MTQEEIAALIGTSRKTVVRRLATIREEARRLAGAPTEGSAP